MTPEERLRFTALSDLICNADPLMPLPDFFVEVFSHARTAYKTPAVPTSTPVDAAVMRQEVTGYSLAAGNFNTLNGVARQVTIAVDGYMINMRLHYQDGNLDLPHMSVVFWRDGVTVGKLSYRDLLLFQLIWVQLTAITMDGLV